jgi:hypothetical protein
MGGGDGVNPDTSFYIDGERGSDTKNNGREREHPFKTLAAAYRAGLAEPNPIRLVVLSDIDAAALEEGVTDTKIPFALQVARDITITGGGTKKVTLRRSGTDSAEDSVLKIGGGAQVTFENITIDGKAVITIAGAQTNGGKNRRALKIIGNTWGKKTKVTLGKGAIITGMIDSGSGVNQIDKDGSGILVSGYAELAMTEDSRVSECEAIAANSRGAVAVIDGGAVTMDGTSAVSDNKMPNTAWAYGSGVFVGGDGSTFTMGGSAKISGNTVDSATIYGAGVYVVSGGTFTMGGNAKVIGNKANGSGESRGGGINVSGGKVVMNNSAAVTGNEITSSSGAGGGVYIENGTFEMRDSATVNGNTISVEEDGVGGGIYLRSGSFTMVGGTVSGNTITVPTNNKIVGGGGLCQNGGTFVMSGGTIYGNTAGTLSNTASAGAAAYYRYGSVEKVSPLSDSTNNTIIRGVVQ